MKAFLVLPNHLFECLHETVYQCDIVFIIEEPMHFYDIRRPFNYNKVKLAYLRACMKVYFDYLIGKKIKVEYVDYDKIGSYDFLQKYDKVVLYDPFDFELLDKYKKLKIKLDFIIDSPMFLSKTEWNIQYASSKQGKHMSNGHFYKFLKKKLKLLEETKSYDLENRKTLPPNFSMKNDLQNLKNQDNSKYYLEAISYINRHSVFKSNIGEIHSVELYPITFKDAKNVLQRFLEKKLHSFGDYQDAIDKDNVFLYHSCLSASMNIGILAPEYIIKTTMAFYKQNQSKIKINNLEGFIRQIVGWREFCFMIYSQCYNELITSNHFNSVNKLKWNNWYGKETGIEILDLEIKKCVKYGYAHHIVRLMVFLNIFVLLQVDPYQVKRWFMEICAIDSYEWVMVSNIWAMGYYSNKFMSKPYISTEAYLLKMSNYQKKKYSIWSALYYRFLSLNRNKLTGSSSVLLRNLVYFDNLPDKEQTEKIKLANAFSKHLLS